MANHKGDHPAYLPETSMRHRLWQKYMKRKGYEWDGYKAPEQTPDVQMDSVLALMEIVEELEKRVAVLEGLERDRKGF